MNRLAPCIFASMLCACNLGGSDTSWVSVTRGELVVGVDVSGQLASTESHVVGPPTLNNVWNFKIASMAEEGQHVEAGSPVLAFDTQELRQRLEEYQNHADSAAKELAAHRSAARMAVKDAQLGIHQSMAAERKAKLKAAGSSDVVAVNEMKRAKLELEFAEYATDVAERKLDARNSHDRAEVTRLSRVQKRSQQRVEEIQTSMAAMAVPAPISGTVLYVTDWQGNEKKVGDSAWRAEKIVEVVSLEHMKAEGEVDEMDASRVAVGQVVSIRLDANADIELSGEVIKIEDTVQRRSPDNPLKVVKLEIKLEESTDLELRPGMRFRGIVETERITEVIVVPIDAVFATADGAFVYKKDGRKAVPTEVELGRRGAHRVEVVSGLAVGDQVAIVEADKSDKKGGE